MADRPHPPPLRDAYALGPSTLSINLPTISSSSSGSSSSPSPSEVGSFISLTGSTHLGQPPVLGLFFKNAAIYICFVLVGLWAAFVPLEEVSQDISSNRGYIVMIFFLSFGVWYAI